MLLAALPLFSIYVHLVLPVLIIYGVFAMHVGRLSIHRPRLSQLLYAKAIWRLLSTVNAINE